MDDPGMRASQYEYTYNSMVKLSIPGKNVPRGFFIGKTMDTFCPMGPSIVHNSLIRDPYYIQIITRVNGVEKQNGNTKNMIYKIDDIIHALTKSITLKPVDVILKSTPVGVGVHRNPPEFLKTGDVIESECANCYTKLSTLDVLKRPSQRQIISM